MTDIITTDPTYNPPRDGIPITNYSDDDYLSGPSSVSEKDNGIDFPSYFLPEGVFFPP